VGYTHGGRDRPAAGDHEKRHEHVYELHAHRLAGLPHDGVAPGREVLRGADVWWGSLVTGMRNASGQMHMRNRYYDPASGQFTQPDPIGLAGGLNAYGFAAGDPVSYSDPYGLCPEHLRNPNTGLCPGNLTVQEWQAVMDQVPNMSDASGARTETMLVAGLIRGDNLPGDIFGEVRPEAPDAIYINRTFNGPVSDGVTYRGSIFENPTELGKTVVHEGKHTFQLRGIYPGRDANEFMRVHGGEAEFQARIYHLKNYRGHPSP
jgi:RHS repeat-associated protein